MPDSALPPSFTRQFMQPSFSRQFMQPSFTRQFMQPSSSSYHAVYLPTAYYPPLLNLLIAASSLLPPPLLAVLYIPSKTVESASPPSFTRPYTFHYPPLLPLCLYLLLSLPSLLASPPSSQSVIFQLLLLLYRRFFFSLLSFHYCTCPPSFGSLPSPLYGL